MFTAALLTLALGTLEALAFLGVTIGTYRLVDAIFSDRDE